MDYLSKIKGSIEDSFKINMPRSEYNQLVQDATMFGYAKDNSKPNMNRFLNDLIINYIDDYSKTIEKTTQSILKTLRPDLISRKETEFLTLARRAALEIHTQSGTYNRDLDRRFSLTIRSSSRDKVAETMAKTSEGAMLSVYLRGLFKDYLSLPECDRELVIFSELIDKLSPLLNKKKIKYKTQNGELKTMSPYSIEHSNHQLRNYLIGESNNNHHIMSIRLMNIENVIETDELVSFREDFQKCYSIMEKSGFQFGGIDGQIRKIKLTEKGYGIFNSRFLDRPVPVNDETLEDGSHILSFDCSLGQLEFYFKPFEYNKEMQCEFL